MTLHALKELAAKVREHRPVCAADAHVAALLSAVEALPADAVVVERAALEDARARLAVAVDRLTRIHAHLKTPKMDGSNFAKARDIAELERATMHGAVAALDKLLEES